MKTETQHINETNSTDTSIKHSSTTQRAVLGISISLFLMNLDASIVSVGLPAMITDFNTSFATGQWFVLVYLLVLTALITSAGRLGDIAGKKKWYLAGIAIFTVASLFCGLSGSAAWFILFRGLQGIGAAFILSLGMAIATELVQKKELGKVIGILSTVTALGVASGPTIGGLLLSAFGWQWMFLVNIPFGIIAYLLIYNHVNIPAVKKERGIDWLGIILLAATLSCYCTGMTLVEKKGISNPGVLILLAITLLALFVFIQIQKKTKDPLLNISIFKNKLISKNLIVTVLVYTAIVTTIILPPFYLTKAAGFNPLKVGLLMSFGPLITVTLSVYAGKIADKYSAKKVMFYAVLTMAFGCLCMSTITPAQNIAGYLWRIAIIYLGLTFFKTPNNTVIMEIALPEERGLLSSFLSLSRILGQITGTAVMGGVFAVLSGVSETSPVSSNSHSITHGFDTIFLINALIITFAAMLIYPWSFKQMAKFVKPR